MAGKTTLDAILWPLMHIDPATERAIADADRCVICGRRWPLNRHHIVRRGAGELYEGGRKLEKPLIVLCGSGNAGGCHGKAHANMLHFRNDGGCLEFAEFDEPTKYQDALAMGGWSPVTPPGLEVC